MEIKRFITGPIDVNTYIIFDNNTKDCVVFDIGGNVDEISSFIRDNKLKLKAIYATHGHFDHILGAKILQEKFNVPFYVSEADSLFVENLQSQLSMHGLGTALPPQITGYIKENDEFHIGNQDVKVIETPGHTIGGVCFIIGDTLLSGDTLFLESIGRTDFPTGNFEQLKESIKKKLFILDESIKVLPGHGDYTTIGHEKNNNCYV